MKIVCDAVRVGLGTKSEIRSATLHQTTILLARVVVKEVLLILVQQLVATELIVSRISIRCLIPSADLRTKGRFAPVVWATFGLEGDGIF